jgi:hypothetical protein
MSGRYFLTGALLVALSAPGQAQQVSLNFDDLGNCTGTPLSTYGGWIALAAGSTCQTGSYSWLTHAHSGLNYLKTGGDAAWSFLNGPVTFDGMWASGYGTWSVELLVGSSTVNTSYFSAYGTLANVAPGYGGTIDGVRITRIGGYSHLGVDDIAFTGNGQYDVTGDLINNPNATPEPATMLLVASGLGGLALARRRRKQQVEASA